ncbi:hypothetical protein EHS25_001795 [Saitozyma podzolica]|uniref:BZIP domain-containing protein n=1 Tax=Saitozyma podzolica TaxID=1890683 RepID=A0A427YF47_9TREE|nr:hypothetical protein EHS25_001795 [Saitozyma podzolica]
MDFLLPAFSPNNETECLNLNSPFGPTQPIPDYFSLAWNDANDNHFAPTPSTPLPTAFNKAQPQQWSQSPPQPVQQSGQSSACCTRPYYYNTSNSKSLLVGLPSSAHVTAHLSCKLGQKRRVSSLDSDVEHSHDEQEHKMPESVERDGMILGMKVEDYRALSARERKRVRNRISARTFRAKRKQHLSSLESTLGAKDPQKQLAQEEASRLCKEVVDRECSVASGRYAHAAIVAHPGLSEAAASRIQPALRSTRGIGREVILVSGGTVAGAEKNGTHPDAETDLRPTVSERSGRDSRTPLVNLPVTRGVGRSRRGLTTEEEDVHASISIGRPGSHEGRRGRTTDGLDAAHITNIRCHMANVQAVPSTSAACWNDDLKACGRTDVSSRATHDGCDHVFRLSLTDTPLSQAIKSHGLGVGVSDGCPVHESFYRPYVEASQAKTLTSPSSPWPPRIPRPPHYPW